MRAFNESNFLLFFGREREIKELFKRLRYQRYLFVIGPSGSGKSSLIYAGLIPDLQSRDPGVWLVRSMRPGKNPLSSLETQIGCPDLEDRGVLSPVVQGAPTRSQPAERLLLVIDQFEEVFTQATRADQATFIDRIKALRRVNDCVVVATLRADFYPDLMNCGLWPVSPGHRLDIAPLRGEALRTALRCPAERMGVRVEDRLLDRLIADAADEPGVLPMVQETMVLLWGEMRDRTLTLEAYDRLGDDGRSGLAAAMSARADASIDALSDAEQVLARRIFLRLVQFGEGREDTRRQQSLVELRAAGDDQALFDETVLHLAENRLLTLSGDETGPDCKVDLAHESLIRGWPTLRKWLAERREAEQVRRRLEVKVQDWLRTGRGGGLLDKFGLTEAERWLSSPDSAELGYDVGLPALVEASRAAVELAETERARQRVLELSHRQFQTIAEHSPVMIWRTGADGTLEYANRKMMDYIIGFCGGTSLSDWDGWVHPEERHLYVDTRRGAIERRVPYQITYRIVTLEAGCRWIEVQASPQFNNENEYEGHLGTCTDVTGSEELRLALRESEKRKYEFLMRLAHELRNPLAPTRLALQMLRLPGLDEKQEEDALKVAEVQLGRVVRMIDDLLDVSRISRSTILLRREAVRIDAVIERSIEVIRPLIEEHHHEIVVSIPDEGLWLEADPVRLEQVLVNLLTNAAKYTNDGGHISITSQRNRGWLIIQIRDDGIGIPAEELPYIFDLFAQGEVILDWGYSGLGIGLTISRGLVEMHGGTLTATSDGAGRGSTFIIRLPATDPSVEKTTSPVPESRTAPARLLRILVVEDNKEAANMLIVLMKHLGHQVDLAQDGPSAISLAREIRPDVMLVDIGLPAMDGYQVVQQLKSAPGLEGTIFVGTSGYGQVFERSRSLEAGFDHHLVKPVDVNAILKIINNL
jgi:PAS domain S-box-containing protein